MIKCEVFFSIFNSINKVTIEITQGRVWYNQDNIRWPISDTCMYIILSNDILMQTTLTTLRDAIFSAPASHNLAQCSIVIFKKF